jgi:hypothetical protein
MTEMSADGERIPPDTRHLMLGGPGRPANRQPGTAALQHLRPSVICGFVFMTRGRGTPAQQEALKDFQATADSSCSAIGSK